MAYLSMSRKNRYKRLRRLFRRYKLYIVSIVVIASIALLCFFVGNAQAGVAEAPSESRNISEESLLNLVATTSVAAHEPKPMTTVSPEETEPCEIEIAREDVEMLAKLIWGEARGVRSKEQKAAVVWCVLNRVDSPLYPDSIEAVVTQKYQFSGYNESYPLTDEFMEIAEDVLVRWYQEKAGAIDVGRVLPKEYLYFVGDGVLNYFSKEWKSQDHYDWSLPSPYED